jgi:hypothetical protein
MGPPTSPIALSAAYLSLLQTRQGAPMPLRGTPPAPPAPAGAPPETPPGTGRGRLIDLLA